ncbi:peptidase M19 [Sphingomonas panacisoli]|uniref:Peptidase M19 n=1 Tax=Sphingomonas panacisoli TaxID=1813879 RepID=A0A5B8LJ37_9SPHN|nr:dipeptidase [Sphingomonas panacisoli]QDZ08193.1 peptidase M19 [Sphingomonas panacisoli]
MRKWIFGGLGLILIAAVAFFVFAPGIVENQQNKVQPVAFAVSPRAAALQRTLDVADMHADSLLWKRDLLTRSTRGMVDLPRLQEGHYALQIFSSVTKTPKGQNYDGNSGDTDNITTLVIADLQPVRTWGSLLQRSLYHADKLKDFAARSNGQMRLITSAQDLMRLMVDRADPGRWPVAPPSIVTSPPRQPPVGAMLSIEGLQDLEGNIANLDKLYAAGFRMAGLAHFFDNDVAGSMHGLKKGGLTPLGVAVVRRMEKLGMVVDVAHSSHAAVAEIIAMARRPLVSSHGGVQATCKVNRNLTDDEVRGIAKTGGVIGIGYWDAAVCSTKPADVAKAIAYVRDLVGIDHVGLGSDFDGAVTTGFDASQVAAITQALIDRGFSDDDIRKVMGGNVIRVLLAGMVPGK